MWRSCVDVIATCNMAHIEIDIIILDRGFNPEIRSFKPDPEFPQSEDDKQKPERIHEMKQGKMTLLNYKNTHFNQCSQKIDTASFPGTYLHVSSLWCWQWWAVEGDFCLLLWSIQKFGPVPS